MRYLSTICMIASMAVPSLAQVPATDVLSQSIAAHGGPAVTAVQTVEIHAALVALGNKQETPVVVSAAMDGRLRIDFGSPAERFIVVSNDGTTEYRGKQAIKLPSHVGAFSALDMLSVFGVQRFAAPGNAVTAADSANGSLVELKAATHEEKRFYGRKITDEATVEVDKATGLILSIQRVQYANQSLDRPFIAGQRFSDYRSVKGVLFPFRIESSIDGRVVAVFSVTSVIFNPALSPLTWERP